MEELAEAELIARAQRAQESAENTERNLAAVVNRASALTNMAAYWDSVGRCRYQLGSKELALEAFSRVARLLWERVSAKSPGYSIGSGLLSALERAIISEEQSTLLAASRYEDARASEGLSAIGAHYCQALQALCRGDEARGRQAAGALERITDSEAEKEKFYPRLGAAVASLLAKDERRFGDAINRILECHVHYSTKGHLRGLEAAFICVPATCLSALAKGRGVSISPDPRWLRAKMKFPVTNLEQWQGRPTRGLKFDLEVNCLP